MVIHRAGSAPNKPTPRQRLGCILVTIDDLDALMQIMETHQTDEEPLRVRFSGGYFTDANDLRSLSDYELEALVVSAGTTSVNLSHYTAVVSSEDESRRSVVSSWADARQTKLASPSRTSREKFSTVALLILAIALTALVGFGIFGPGPIGTENDTARGVTIATGSISAIVMLGIYIGIRFLYSRDRRDYGYAVIEPRTMAEFRDRQNSDHRPRQANIIAGISVGVAVVAAVIAVWAIYAPK